MLRHAHVEDRDHDLDAARHGGWTEEEEDPLLVATELPQVTHNLVELHGESPLWMFCPGRISTAFGCWVYRRSASTVCSQRSGTCCVQGGANECMNERV